ncbi:MAG: nitroreductase family deazaflavin-dependent oxidoreductase, partial [Anaerolineales bacterium]|nr:nitroreductase family deazaflavin-dependent oxidoreductase [Anaerolineales bacterium]
LLGGRFLLLNHVGRKSGQPRQAVLEVVDYDAAHDTYFVASGFGRRAQWFQNLQANPEVTIQVGRRRLAVTADIFPPEESGARMADYARRHPRAAAGLLRLIGYEADGSEAQYREIGRDHIPFIALRPKLLLDDRAGLSPWWLLLPAALLLLLLLGPRASRPPLPNTSHRLLGPRASRPPLPHNKHLASELNNDH